MISFRWQPFEEDVLILGKGGSGKTELAKRLILRVCKSPLWLWDHRWQYGDLRSEGYYISHDLADLPYGRTVFQPRTTDIATFDEFCAKALTHYNLVLAVEEAHLFSGKYKIKSDKFAEIINSGRPQGISYVLIARRPQQLHNDILADAEHLFTFELELTNDYLYMQNWIGDDIWRLREKENRPRSLASLNSGVYNADKLPPHYSVHRSTKTGVTDWGKA